MKSHKLTHTDNANDGSRKRKRKPNTPISTSSSKAKSQVSRVEPPKKRRRKGKKKQQDGAFNPRGKSRPGAGNGDPLNLRIKFKNKEEKIVAAYYLENVEGIDQAVAKHHIREAVTAIRDGIPLSLNVKERSSTGTPTKVITPGRTLYHLTKRHGSVLFFSNVPKTENKTVTTLDKSNPLYASEPFKDVREYDADTKKKSVTITKKLMQATKREKARSTTARQQNPIMAKSGVNASKASAKQYARATGAFPSDQEWEWLHLIAHDILGKISQHKGNLVCGSYHGNTDMIFVEAQVKKLLKRFPNGIDLDVTAHMVKGTQICHQIEYVYRTENFRLPFVFDVQTNIEPHHDHKKYMNAFTSGVLKAVPEKGEEEEEKKSEQVHEAEASEKGKEKIDPQKDDDKENIYFKSPKSGNKNSIFLRKKPLAQRSLNFDADELAENPVKIKSKNG